MQDVVIKHGVLRSWHADKGYGFVEVPTPTFPLEKYFLHASDIFEGENPPPIGCRVRFEVGAARLGGRFPIARRAWIVAPAGGAA